MLSDETQVTITWGEPSTTGGEGVPITYYKIEILMPTGLYEQVCDGYDPTLISTRTCKVDMADFLTDPFNFAQGAAIKARITAAN